MKCEKCQNKATMHTVNVVNNKKEEHYYCEECAKKYAKIEHVFHKYDPDELMKAKSTTKQGAMESIAEQIDKMMQDALKDISTTGYLPIFQGEMKACAKCGMTIQDFIKTGKFGCPNDYEIFAEEIGPLIQRLQGGNVQHIGKMPSKRSSKERIKMLEAEMNSAIRSENYERAAQIRDQLKDLQKDS